MQGSNPTSSPKRRHKRYWHNLRSPKKWERVTRADLVGRFSAEAGLELRPEDGLSDFGKPLGVGDQVPENSAGKNDRFRIRWHFWAGGGKKVVFEGKNFCWSEKPETGFFLLLLEADFKCSPWPQWSRFFRSIAENKSFFGPDVLIRFSDTCAMNFSVAPSDADARHFFA